MGNPSLGTYGKKDISTYRLIIWSNVSLRTLVGVRGVTILNLQFMGKAYKIVLFGFFSFFFDKKEKKKSRNKNKPKVAEYLGR